MNQYTTQTPQGTVVALMTGAVTIYESLHPNPIREVWKLTLRQPDGTVTMCDRKLVPGRMGPDFIKSWAYLQTPEGKAANRARCDRAIAEIDLGTFRW